MADWGMERRNTPEDVWQEWRRVLHADLRRCPEGDETTDALQVADGFMRRMLDCFESQPVAEGEA